MTAAEIRTLREGFAAFEADFLAAGLRRAELEAVVARAEAGEELDAADLAQIRAAMGVFEQLLARNSALGPIQ